MRQETAERILRSHLAKYGCEVELGTSLSTFEQHPNYVKANLVKSFDGRENIETTNFDWIIGADGARSMCEIYFTHQFPVLISITQVLPAKGLD